MQLSILTILIAVLAFFIIVYLTYKLSSYKTNLKWQKNLVKLRGDIANSQRANIKGKVTETFAPFLKGFPFKASECKFIGDPLDYVVFKGLDERDIKGIHFVEVKSGDAKLSKHQKEIIRLVRNNGRYEIVDIARKLGLNVKTVMAKIKDLEKKGIVQGYITIIDQEKLGVQYYKFDISFQDHTEKQYKCVLEYCKNNKYVVNLMTSIGDWEIELEAEADTVEELHEFAKNLRIKFPTIIKKVDLHIITKEIKVDYLPEWF